MGTAGFLERAVRASCVPFLLLCLTAAAVPLSALQHPLDDVVSVVRTTSFESPDADLLPLIEAIGSARVVVLGEATHSDGAMTGAKARVARFLHDRMGFDVLAWETGFLQAHAMNVALRDPATDIEDAAAFLMSGGWAWDAAIQPLFEHARSSWGTQRPLVMAGFDTGRPHRAAPAFMEAVEGLLTVAPSLRESVDTAALRSLAVRGFGFLSPELTPPDVRAAELAVLKSLEDALVADHDSLRVYFSERELAFLRVALTHLRTSEYLKEARGTERAYLRDREMARLMRWLMDEAYPGRKIIVWAATAHFIRNSDLIANAGDSTMYVVPYHAGNHLGAWFGPDLYTLAFTSYGGELGESHPTDSQYPTDVRAVPPPDSSTLEGRLHGLGHEYAFIDLHQATAAGALDREFRSIMLGRFDNVAPWALVVDGVFFIDRSEPVRNIH